MDPSVKTDIDLVEYQEFQGRTESAFVYEDPRDAGAKSPLERRLLLKADILIVGITSLVFLVNQWVCLSQVAYVGFPLISFLRIEETLAMPVSWAFKRIFTCPTANSMMLFHSIVSFVLSCCLLCYEFISNPLYSTPSSKAAMEYRFGVQY